MILEDVIIILRERGSTTSKKDIQSKILEDYSDVFADIFNTLLFEKELINESGLKSGPTESVYKSNKAYAKEQRRDVLKNYQDSFRFIISAFGIENQMTFDKTMPIRIMGYDYGSYRQQVIDNQKKLYPVITIVLNFSDKEWNTDKSLHELLDIPEEFLGYVQDYKIRVFNIAFLKDATINSFKSDFKVIARFFKDKRLNRSAIADDNTEIKHVKEVMDMLSAFTNDNRYREATAYVEKIKKAGGTVTMCWIAQMLEEKGIEKGRIQTLAALVKDGTITEEKAASQADMTLEEYRKAVAELV